MFEDIKKELLPILKEYLEKLEKVTLDELNKMKESEICLNLTKKGISPEELISALEELGYEEYERDIEKMHCIISLKRTDDKTFVSSCENIIIMIDAMKFSLKLSIAYL